MAKDGAKTGSGSPGGGMSVRICMTREMVERNELPSQQGDCKTTRQSRSGNTMKMAFSCSKPPSSGEGQVTFVSPEAYNSKMVMTSMASGNAAEDRHGRQRQVAGRRLRQHQADGAAHERLRAQARRASRAAAGRPPKTAVPMRTIVLPAAIAASRSAVMPIDKVSTARPAPRRLSNKALARRCTAFWASKPSTGSGMVISPRSAIRGSRATSRASASTSCGATPDLVGPPSMFTWMHTCSGSHSLGPLLGQALRHLEPVDRVRPMEVGRHQPRLVALDRAYAMPFQRKFGQQRDLLHRFLDVVFAKGDLARRKRLAHRFGAEGLGHRQQPDFLHIALRRRTGSGHPLANTLEVGANRGHNQPTTCNVFQQKRGFVDITQLLAFSVKNKASDLHLSAGLPPMIRVHGDVRRINIEALDHKQVHAMVYDIMNDTQRKTYEEFLEVDFSFEIDGLARFRVNAFNQYRGAGAVFRTIPSKILTLEQLNAPKIFGELALKPRGMVLVTGPTGSGKSTTLAAMVNFLNETEYGHILTVEDPIEFVHDSKKCLINQREVGNMTLSFAAALRSALREDPDAILVGEMRDLETIRLAMTAAETGHLVFGTLHTSSAAKTVDRIIDVFPAEEKEMIRAMLSESLQAVISQTLCKTKDGNGRVAAHEIMIGTSAIRNLIREAKIAQMYSAIQTGNAYGMQTLDQNLADLVKRNMISPAEARGKAKIPDNFPG